MRKFKQVSSLLKRDKNSGCIKQRKLRGHEVMFSGANQNKICFQHGYITTWSANQKPTSNIQMVQQDSYIKKKVDNPISDGMIFYKFPSIGCHC